jgi:hypothetical protein
MKNDIGTSSDNNSMRVDERTSRNPTQLIQEKASWEIQRHLHTPESIIELYGKGATFMGSLYENWTPKEGTLIYQARTIEELVSWLCRRKWWKSYNEDIWEEEQEIVINGVFSEFTDNRTGKDILLEGFKFQWVHKNGEPIEGHMKKEETRGDYFEPVFYSIDYHGKFLNRQIISGSMEKDEKRNRSEDEVATTNEFFKGDFDHEKLEGEWKYSYSWDNYSWGPYSGEINMTGIFKWWKFISGRITGVISYWYDNKGNEVETIFNGIKETDSEFLWQISYPDGTGFSGVIAISDIAKRSYEHPADTFTPRFLRDIKTTYSLEE